MAHQKKFELNDNDLAIASTYLSRPRRSVFYMMRTWGRIFVTSNSICWNAYNAQHGPYPMGRLLCYTGH